MQQRARWRVVGGEATQVTGERAKGQVLEVIVSTYNNFYSQKAHTTPLMSLLMVHMQGTVHVIEAVVSTCNNTGPARHRLPSLIAHGELQFQLQTM